MLAPFLTQHRHTLIARCEAKVAARPTPRHLAAPTRYGIPVFLDQLITTLKITHGANAQGSRLESSHADGVANAAELAVSATRHGRELLEHGYTVEQVVRDYGDLCQAITQLAIERDADISTGEFKTLNQCLDNGIAGAVTEFARRREIAIKATDTREFNQKLGVLAHELRNHISTATLAVVAIRTGNVGLTGATAKILDRSLVGLKNLIDRSLAEVRVGAGLPERHRLLPLAGILEEARFSASFEASWRGCELTAEAADPSVAVDTDEEMLLAAIANLVQNAMKFTAPGTEVLLSSSIEADRVRIHVQDHCGGLPPGAEQAMFRPFSQHGADRSGVGLGLSICKQSVEANKGLLSVRDVPGSGCIFTIDLPRHTLG